MYCLVKTMKLSPKCLLCLWLRYLIPFCESFRFQAVSQGFKTSVRHGLVDNANRFDAVGLSDIGSKGKDNNKGNDPYTEISWRQRLETSISNAKDIPGFNYVQLATIDSETNEPRCRSIVFRGFLHVFSEESSIWNECGKGLSTILVMVTDARSDKIRHIRENPSAEIHWWFANSTEQYRIRGTLEIVDKTNSGLLSQARVEKWERLSDAGRAGFFRDKQSGEPYQGESLVANEGRLEGTISPPPDTFVLLLLVPHFVDYLQLKSLCRQTNVRDEEGHWKWYRVNV